MKEPAILWEQISISNWQFGLCISSHTKAISTQQSAKPITAKDAKDAKEEEVLDFRPFATFASVAVKFLWLTADC